MVLVLVCGLARAGYGDALAHLLSLRLTWTWAVCADRAT